MPAASLSPSVSAWVWAITALVCVALLPTAHSVGGSIWGLSRVTPQGRGGHSVVVLDSNKLVVFGGYKDGA
jgi:hypothetical protein